MPWLLFCTEETWRMFLIPCANASQKKGNQVPSTHVSLTAALIQWHWDPYLLNYLQGLHPVQDRLAK